MSSLVETREEASASFGITRLSSTVETREHVAVSAPLGTTRSSMAVVTREVGALEAFGFFNLFIAIMACDALLNFSVALPGGGLRLKVVEVFPPLVLLSSAKRSLANW